MKGTVVFVRPSLREGVAVFSASGDVARIEKGTSHAGHCVCGTIVVNPGDCVVSAYRNGNGLRYEVPGAVPLIGGAKFNRDSSGRVLIREDSSNRYAERIGH